MEPRAALAEYDALTGRYTLYAGGGGAVRSRPISTSWACRIAVRVVMRDVGGNFGTRNMIYPEFALVAWAARRVGRPVKWTCERQEAFLSDYQARDSREAELALDKEGTSSRSAAPTSATPAPHDNFVPLKRAPGACDQRVPHAGAPACAGVRC